MGFNREDFYDVCKGYVQYIELLEFIDDYLKYDIDESVEHQLKSYLLFNIESIEKKYHNRILK